MSDVYVSGPVVRRDTSILEWVRGTYDLIYRTAGEMRLEVSFPVRDDRLDVADPRTFYDSIRERISDARIAIVVFTGGDVSAGIEACLAANLRKPMALISPEPQALPRLVVGLPTVAAVLRPDRNMANQLSSFIAQNLRGPATAF